MGNLSRLTLVPPKANSLFLAPTTAALLTPSRSGATSVHLLVCGSYCSTCFRDTDGEAGKEPASDVCPPTAYRMWSSSAEPWPKRATSMGAALDHSSCSVSYTQTSLEAPFSEPRPPVT